MEEDRPGRVPGGHDFEYDQAHDCPVSPAAEPPVPHRVDAPHLNLDPGGDYGYDEAHDFGSS